MDRKYCKNSNPERCLCCNTFMMKLMPQSYQRGTIKASLFWRQKKDIIAIIIFPGHDAIIKKHFKKKSMFVKSIIRFGNLMNRGISGIARQNKVNALD